MVAKVSKALKLLPGMGKLFCKKKKKNPGTSINYYIFDDKYGHVIIFYSINIVVTNYVHNKEQYWGQFQNLKPRD